MLSSAVVLLVWLRLSEAITSQRAKCAVECYVRCVNSGTPNAAYCACPLPTLHNACNSINEDVLKADTIDDVFPVKTEYLDAHTIHILMSPNPKAFIYIFEFSTVSTSPEDWMFAGVSLTPQITFTTPDPCRDYQFRVLIVLRSTNPMHQLVVLRPRAIRVTLPEFAVATDQIHVQHPIYNSANRTLTIYVTWKIPRGYTSADIFGYEGAAVYPIQCLSPEDELPTPTVEAITGGGRLKVSLPAEMLEGKCRLWMEVRMLPKCVRLQPFSVQQSLELDCEKLPTLDICRHEVSPQCTDVIDVWGSNGNATIMWAPPAHFGDPLYYHVRYGPAQMQGVSPFTSWAIASRRETKTSGNITSMNILLDEDTDYGIQVCAVYNEQRKKPKFGLVRVTPFICTSCQTMPAESFGRCGECSKIEGPLLFDRRCHPKGGIGCTSALSKPKEIDLANTSPSNRTNSLKDLTLRSKVPLEIEHSNKDDNISIIERAAPAIVHSKIFSPDNLFLHHARQTTAFMATVAPTTAYLTAATESYPALLRSSIQADISLEVTSTQLPRQYDVRTATLVTELNSSTATTPSTLIKASSSHSTATMTSASTITYLPTATTVLTPSELPISTAASVSEGTSTQKEGTSENRYPPTDVKDRHIGRNVQTTFTMATTTSKVRTLVVSNRGIGNLATTTKLSEDEDSCALLNGVLCQFGCASREKCECPESSHVTAVNGACVQRTMKTTSSTCLAKRDVNATWDSRLRALHIYSREVFNEVKEKKAVDKVYVEFGQVREAKLAIGKPSQNVHLNGYVFDSSVGQRNRMVVRKDKILRHGLFLTSPFLFYVNQSVDPIANIYGLRICSFNSTLVKYPFQTDWDIEGSSSNAEERSSNVVQVLQLSPIHFFAELVQPSTLYDSRHLSRLFFIIAPLTMIVVMIMLISALLYLNCSRIKRFCDRRRTRYFRPYVMNAGAATIGPYISRGTDTSPHSHSLFFTKPTY